MEVLDFKKLHMVIVGKRKFRRGNDETILMGIRVGFSMFDISLCRRGAT